jgi:hypothetical protein
VPAAHKPILRPGGAWPLPPRIFSLTINLSMQTPETTSNSTPAALLPKLMGFARLVKSLAERFKGVARFLAVSGLLSVLWLGWYFVRSHGFPPVAAILTGLLMLLPVLLLGWCWYVLDQACDMPERLTEWIGRAKGYAGETVQRLAGTSPPARGGLGELGQVGGLLYELRSMGEDTRDLFTVFGGSLAFTNPLFLIAVAVSALLIVAMDAGAIITGIVALF